LDLEAEVLPVLDELGISLVAYSPLGRGFLTGQIKSHNDFEPGDWRTIAPRFQGENFYKNLEIVKKLEEYALLKKTTVAQLALAWILAQRPNLFPIPGTRRISALEENAGAVDVVLSEEEIKAIRNILPQEIAGNRYPDRAMGFLNL
jgi:aryl-alcohol dehydrogenase-like predicted oxidoreductase